MRFILGYLVLLQLFSIYINKYGIHDMIMTSRGPKLRWDEAHIFPSSEK
jgi:hypothetical protein